MHVCMYRQTHKLYFPPSLRMHDSMAYVFIYVYIVNFVVCLFLCERVCVCVCMYV